MNITLSDALVKQLEERVQQSDDFSSVQQYVEYVLAEVLKQTQTSSTAKQPENDSSAYTKEQEEEVKKRLEDLGYLD